jgi:hypothetical protein
MKETRQNLLTEIDEWDVESDDEKIHVNLLRDIPIRLESIVKVAY